MAEVAAMSPSREVEEKNCNKVLKNVATVVCTGFFLFLSTILVYPLFCGLIASFRPGRELIRRGLALNLDPSEISLNNYLYLFSNNADAKKYWMWFRNSMVLTLITVFLTLIVCYFVSYGVTMYKTKLGSVIYILVIATMMVPFEILMMPLYQEMIDIKLIDTMGGVILPGLCAASTIFFFHQYMISLPKDLLDAGRIDGANEYYIAVRIMMPICKPAFSAMAILCAMGSWNNMLWPLMVFRSANKFTLTIGLNTLLTPYGNNYDVLIAGSMLAIVPIMAVFLVFQRYIIDGITTGAVKG